MKDKRGTDKIISVYWFVILFLVAGAVVYMVYVFYGNNLDVREIEADVMINKVADCLSQGGELVQDVKQENFMDKCKLKFNTEFEGQGEYYLEINFYEFNDLSKPIDDLKITQGNPNLKIYNISKSNSAVSHEKSFYVLNEDNGQHKEMVVKILSIIRKTERNVK